MSRVARTVRVLTRSSATIVAAIATPQVPGRGGTEMAVEREAELLPVSYFHVVYTLPSQLRDIAYQNKRVIYDLLAEGGGRNHARHRSRSAPGARIGIMPCCTWGRR